MRIVAGFALTSSRNDHSSSADRSCNCCFCSIVVSVFGGPLRRGKPAFGHAQKLAELVCIKPRGMMLLFVSEARIRFTVQKNNVGRLQYGGRRCSSLRQGDPKSRIRSVWCRFGTVSSVGARWMTCAKETRPRHMLTEAARCLAVMGAPSESESRSARRVSSAHFRTLEPQLIRNRVRLDADFSSMRIVQPDRAI
jgi:hypothetical protein